MRSNEGGSNRWVPPPGGVIGYRNVLENEIETLTKHNDFCKACYTVSRDIGVLATELPPEHAGKLQIFLWEFELMDMIDGAAAGCHFCGLFVLRYFVNSWMMSGGNGVSRSDVACCSQAPKNREMKKELLEAIDKLREFSEQNPGAHLTFIVEPVDYKAEDASFCRVRFSAKSSRNVDGEAFARMVMMIDIDLEFFAVKGVYFL